MSRSYLRARPRGLARPPAPVQTAAAQARACVPSKRPLCAAGAAPRASHRPPNLHAQPPAAPRQPSLPPEKIPQLAGAAPGGAAAAVLALLGLDRDRLRWAHLRRRPARLSSDQTPARPRAASPLNFILSAKTCCLHFTVFGVTPAVAPDKTLPPPKMRLGCHHCSLPSSIISTGGPAHGLAELARDAALLAGRVAPQHVLAAEARADRALLEGVVDLRPRRRLSAASSGSPSRGQA